MKSNIQYRTVAYMDGVDLLTCRDATSHFPKHFHEGYNLWFNSAGGESVWHRGSTRLLQSADIGIINPGEVHANKGIGDTRCLQSFYISPKRFNTFAGAYDMKVDKSIEFHKIVFTDAKLKQDLIDLHLFLQQEHDVLECESRLIVMMGQLLNYSGGIETHDSKVTGYNKMGWVKDYLHSHFETDIRLEDLAKMAGISAHHLIRTFKKCVGVPPHQYLMQIRLQHVVDLLKDGHSITGAAIDAGFVDQSHMHRYFRRRFGVTPAEYQKHISE